VQQQLEAAAAAAAAGQPGSQLAAAAVSCTARTDSLTDFGYYANQW